MRSLSQPVVDLTQPGRPVLITSPGSADGGARKVGELYVVQLVRRPHGGVLTGQPGAEQQRVVGPERDGGTGSHQLGQRHRGEVAVDAEGDVGDRTDLQGDAARDDQVEQGGVLHGADPVAPVSYTHLTLPTIYS